MNLKSLKIAFLSVAALMVTTLRLVGAPTPDDGVKYATSVVLVKRVVQDGRVHSYVKEVWRAAPNAGAEPSIGSEYGRSFTYRSGSKFNEGDYIVFEFMGDPASNSHISSAIPVREDQTVPSFSRRVRVEELPVSDYSTYSTRMETELFHLAEVRRLVKKTKPKPLPSELAALIQSRRAAIPFAFHDKN